MATIFVFVNEVTVTAVAPKTTVGFGVVLGSKLVPTMVIVFVDPYVIVTPVILGICANDGEAAKNMVASTTAH